MRMPTLNRAPVPRENAKESQLKKHRLRIIAGERRGWRIEAPESADVTRPITDRVKENLFNIIQTLVPDAVVLDLFAGTGSIGLEALSRGAAWVTFVEQHREIVELLRRNIAFLGYEDRSRVVPGSALRFRPDIRRRRLPGVAELRQASRPPGPRPIPPPEQAPPAEAGDLVFDLVFLDPPYRMMQDDLTRRMIGESLTRLVELGAVALAATIVLRHDSANQFECDWPGFVLTQSRRYGSMTLEFLTLAPPGAPSDTEADHG